MDLKHAACLIWLTPNYLFELQLYRTKTGNSAIYPPMTEVQSIRSPFGRTGVCFRSIWFLFYTLANKSVHFHFEDILTEEEDLIESFTT